MSTKQSSAWIFVSHSIRDLTAVRRIRNALEERDANPILFFLKQRIPDDLLRNFLRREIEERNFFVRCDSENSRNSEYVRFEVEHVKSLSHVKRATVDLSATWDDQVHVLERMLSEATVFVSYAHQDRDVARPFVDALISADFAVFDPARALLTGSSWQQSIQSAIREAARQGYFVQLLSAASAQNSNLAVESGYFLSASGGRRPVLVALEPLGSIRLPSSLSQYQIIDAPRLGNDRAIELMMRSLGL